MPKATTQLSVDQLFSICVLLMAAWLIASIYLVNIEFDDGYSTMVNSKYFLGQAEDYFSQRGPLMAILLIPAQWVARWLGLHPLDVRAQHLTMAILHFGYLLGVWRILIRHHASELATLLAYLAAIPTVVFFSYAPFISHDILPGLVVLLMLVLAHDYMRAPSRRNWVALILLGSSAVMVKHTYAAIWIAILIASAWCAWRADDIHPARLRNLLALFAAGAVSAIIAWCLYGYFLGGVYPGTAFLLRPIAQIAQVLGKYDSEGPVRIIFYQWMYFRNIPAYGILAMALILPGIYLSLRHGGTLQQAAAVTWIVLFAIMQMLAFKEVRYLAFLAPLTAFTIIPAMTLLLRARRTLKYLWLSPLLLDVANATAEAARIAHPYYREQLTDFLAPLPTTADLRAPIIMDRTLSFISPERDAFFGDRYHRITHIFDDQIRLLYGYPRSQMLRIDKIRNLDPRKVLAGSILFFVNDIAVRAPPFMPGNRTSLHDFFMQMLTIAEVITFERSGDVYRENAPDGRSLLILPVPGAAADPAIMTVTIPVDTLAALNGMRNIDIPARMSILAFRIERYCDIQGCRPDGALR